MIHPILAIEAAQARYGDLLQEAEIKRRARKASADRPRLRDRFLLSAGDFLISFGLRLKKRYQAIGQQADLPILQAG